MGLRRNGQIHFSYDLRRELNLKKGDKVCFFDDAECEKNWFLSLTDINTQHREIKLDPRNSLYCTYGPLLARWRAIFPLRKRTQQRLWVNVEHPVIENGNTYYKIEFRG